MSAPNKISYNSSGMPIGSRIVTFKRPTDPNAVAGPATTLGTYLLESSSPKEPSKLVELMGVKGEDTDFATVMKRKTMSAVAQRKTGATTTLQVGDYFEDSFDVDTAGAATANERYVVTDRDNTEVAGEAQKQSITLVLDITNSPRWQ